MTEHYLLDVSLLIACAWQPHRLHTTANQWLTGCQTFATCPSIQMGFLRVSMSVAYGATYDEARAALEDILSMPAHHFIHDTISLQDLPDLESRHDITDAHFVTLARRNEMKLATLDEHLCQKRWASDVAENPLTKETSH